MTVLPHHANLSPPAPAPGAGPGGEAAPHRFSRRSFLKLAGSAATMATISGCSPGPPAAQVRSSGKVQLAFQDCRCLGEQLLLQDFHDANPNIEVFYTPEPEDYEERMLADMQAGVAPVRCRSEYSSIEACPADKTNRSRFGQIGSWGSNRRNCCHRV